MLQFEVDEELAALVERFGKIRPFENPFPSFNEALWRVMRTYVLASADGLQRHEVVAIDKLNGDLRVKHVSGPKKAPTPSVTAWVDSVPELQHREGLTTWKSVCVYLRIDTAGDSARRKLKNWVKQNRPQWPAVPDID